MTYLDDQVRMRDVYALRRQQEFGKVRMLRIWIILNLALLAFLGAFVTAYLWVSGR